MKLRLVPPKELKSPATRTMPLVWRANAQTVPLAPTAALNDTSTEPLALSRPRRWHSAPLIEVKAPPTRILLPESMTIQLTAPLAPVPGLKEVSREPSI